MYAKIPFIKRKIRDLCWRIFNIIENNGDANIEKNGEKVFIKNLFNYFKYKRSYNEIVVFDIGANVGDYTIYLINKAKEIWLNVELLELHLFEPTQSCFDVLKKRFVHYGNVKINKFGASDKNGIANIYYDKEKSGLASLYKRNLKHYNIQMNQSEEIILRRLDEYIKENEIKHIHFIKIDVEGHELKALEGFGEYLNSGFIDFIQFEYGGANLDSRTSLLDLYKFFEIRNYFIAKILPHSLEIRKYEPYMENFMYSNYVAISNEVLNK